MPWYVPVPSPADLDRVLACSWTAVPTGRHRLVPDGCMELLWIDSGALLVCGPETTSWDFELPEPSCAVGVRFRPGAGPAVLAASAAGLAEVRTPLRRIVGRAAEAALGADIDAAGSLDAKRAVLERYVAHLVAARGADLHEALGLSDRILDALASTPRAHTAQLAARLGMTPRQLHRRSLASFGYGTSTLARLLRLQRFLALAEAGGHTQGLALLAIEAGYTDQAHLARDCRAITGQTPSAFLSAYFPTFPDMSDPYKTAEAFAVTMSA